MGHTLELTEDEYTRLEAYARRMGRTPRELVAEWLASMVLSPATPAPATPAPATPAPTPAEEQGDVPPPTEEELREHPILALGGSFAFNDPRLATNFDDVLAEAMADDHAESE